MLNFDLYPAPPPPPIHYFVCTAPPCADGEVRLFGGQVPTEGTIEVCEDGLWQGGTICDDLWDNREAEVVCRQLGFNSTGKCNNSATLMQSP